MQITQFVVGVVFASAHLFVAYETPVSLPYKAMSVLSNSTIASEFAQDWWSDAVQTGRSSGFLPPWAKRLLYRAVGAEGLAESVHDGNIYTNRHAAQQNNYENTHTSPNDSQTGSHHRHSTHYETVRCIDTTGQTFAIWLNVVYLMPLMLLFMRFFVKSYITGPKRSAKAKNAERQRIQGRRFSEHLTEAARRTSDALENFGINAEEAIDDAAEETEKSAEAAGEKISQAQQAVKDGYVSDKVEAIENSETVKQASGKISQAKQAVDDGYIGDRINDAKNSETVKRASGKLSQAKQAVDDGYVGDRIEDVKNSQTVKSANDKLSEVKKAIDEGYIGEKVEDLKNSQVVVEAEDAGENMMESIEEKSKQVDKMLKDSTLGDSYVEVLEKMRQGARQVTGSTDAEEHVEDQESKTYGDGPSTATNETVSSLNKKTSTNEQSSSSSTVQSSSSSTTESTKKENKPAAKQAVKNGKNSKSQIPRSHSPSKKAIQSPSKKAVKVEGTDGADDDDDVDRSLILGRDNSPTRPTSDSTDPTADTYADVAKADVEKVKGESKDWGFGLNG